ncbi:MAG: SsrA-binding protein SmpB [Pseudomonadota bacterium]
MARPQLSKPGTKARVVADNRKARHDYAFEEIMEAGLALTGTEVKALRFGNGNIQDAYAEERGGELWLINSYIPEFKQGNRYNHEPRRPRRLLLHRRQINKLAGAIQRQGLTLVPVSLYFNERGRIKVELALARGKKAHDKRQAIKERDWQRQKGRLLRQHS